jgi:hypothetical protein
MWSYYQPAIIKNIFIPYIIYLVALSLCAGQLTAKFIRSVDTKDGTEEEQALY